VKLTEKTIADLTCPEGAKDRLVFDDSLPGLAVRITPKGKSFLAQYTKGGVRRRVPIGRWGAVTLDAARKAARNILGEVAGGKDVAHQRVEERRGRLRQAAEAKLTLEELLKKWERLALKNKRESYRREALRSLRAAFHDQLKDPAVSVGRASVVEVLDSIGGAGRTASAARTLAYGRACYNWARKRGDVPLNPFADLPALALVPARDRFLTEAELAAVWQAASAMSWPFGPIFQLLLLTAQRREEVIGMRWSELSPDHSTWVIPKERAKNRRAHVVHLAPAAAAIIGGLPRLANSDLVFTTTGRTPVSGVSKAKERLDAAAGKLSGEGGMPPWRLHDFRRTAVTWLAGAGVPPHVCDRLLNHVTGSIMGVAAVYQRQEFLPERKAALERWAEYVVKKGPATADPSS
jgi:integrase